MQTPPRSAPPQLPRQTPSYPYQPPAVQPQLPGGEVGQYMPTAEERSSAMLIHLLSLLTGFIGPVILWAVKKEQSRFIDFHGREAINFLISVFIYSIGTMILAVILGIATAMLGFFLISPLFIVLSIGATVLEILACVAANRGEWHRYPFTIRFF